jgi:hypothetical protein
MKALAVLVHPLVLSGPHTRRMLSENLPQLLLHSLPGIDPNDQRKTAVTMMLSYAVLSCVPVSSSSSPTAETAGGALSRLDYQVDEPLGPDELQEPPMPEVGDPRPCGPLQSRAD